MVCADLLNLANIHDAYYRSHSHGYTPTPDTGAEWEPDEPDTVPPERDTTTETARPERDATDQQPPHPGMTWNAEAGKWVETEPHSREAKYRIQLRAAEAERDQLRER